MAQVVPLNWQGSFGGFGGPLAAGATHHWRASGVWGAENRFYLFSAFSEGGEGEIAAEIEVVNVSHFRGTAPDGSIVDETHFDIHNKGYTGGAGRFQPPPSATPPPVHYYFYIAWSDPINV